MRRLYTQTAAAPSFGGVLGIMRRSLVLTIFAACTAAAGLSPAHAQDANARVVGRVVDAETGRGLVGALVQIEGTRAGALTGLDGRYTLAQVPIGSHVVTVAYIGYADKSIRDFEISSAAAVNLDITMTPAALALEGVTVSVAGERGTISRALDEQRNAVGMVNAITSEQISRGPDSDAAAAVQRVSGVTVQDGRYVFVRGLGERYTTTSLNGSRVPSPEPERKMVPLDLFPAGLLQSITTAKTFTPNLQGDFSGAQVDIRTREYPVGRQVTMSFSQGYNSAVTGSLVPMAPRAGGEWLASATGPRLIPAIVENTPRPQPGPQTNAMVSAMRNAWSVQERTGRPNTSMGLSVGGSDGLFGQEIGYLLSGTYSMSDEVNAGTIRENVEGDRYEGSVGRESVLLGGLFNLSTMLGSHSRIALNNSYNRTADNEARLESGFYENHGTNIQIERLKYIERWVRSNQVMGQHQLGGRHRVDWAVTSAGVSRQEPDRSEFVTWLDPTVPIWYNREGAFRAYGGLTESSLEGSADYRIEVGASRDHLVRFGGLFRSTDRDAYDTGYSIHTREWGPTDARWTAPPEEFFDGRFSNGDQQLFRLGIFNAGGAYGARDRLGAGYLMTEWAVSPRLRFIGGARIEHSAVEVAYEDVLGTTGVSEPSYTDILPSAALNFDLTETQKLRASVSQTLARPEYREIAPICYRAGLGEEQRCGNPDLVRTLIQNVDLRWEHYPNLGEIVSLGLFAKRFSNPIEPRYQGRSGTNSLWFENAESAVNYGVEAEMMRGLDVVSEALADLSVFANATLMKSEVRTGVEGDPIRPMTGQAPYVLNAGLTWTSPGRATSATILYNVVGERITNARPSGHTVLDVVEMPRPGLDLSFRFPVLGALAAKVDFKNLLDSPYELRQGDLLRSYYRSGRSVSAGFSWRS